MTPDTASQAAGKEPDLASEKEDVETLLASTIYGTYPIDRKRIAQLKDELIRYRAALEDIGQESSPA